MRGRGKGRGGPGGGEGQRRGGEERGRWKNRHKTNYTDKTSRLCWTMSVLTVDLLVLVCSVFNGTDIQAGLVGEEQTSRLLQGVGQWVGPTQGYLASPYISNNVS